MTDVPTGPELQRQLVYALIKPAARLCARFRLALGEAEQLFRLAYFEELRRTGASHAEIAEIFGKSLRTVGSIEKAHRSNFLRPEAEVELARRVEDALDAGSRTAEQLAEHLEDVPRDELDRTVAGLLGAGRLVSDGQRLSLDRTLRALDTQLPARVDGLKHQLQVVGAAVRERFLSNRRPSLARTFAFAATAEEAGALADAVASALRARCGEAEDRSLKCPDYEGYALTVALAPTEDDDS